MVYKKRYDNANVKGSLVTKQVPTDTYLNMMIVAATLSKERFVDILVNGTALRISVEDAKELSAIFLRAANEAEIMPLERQSGPIYFEEGDGNLC